MNASGSGADLDPNKSITDPDSDPGGPNTYGSFGSESRTLLPLQHLQLTLALKKDACLKRFSLPDRNHVRTRLIIFFWSAPQKRWRDAKFFPGKTQFQSRTSGHHRESGKSYSLSGCKNPFSLHLRSKAKGTVQEFLNNLWG
jgi:hypothetical protein